MKMKEFILYFGLLICILGLSFYLWKLGKQLNYEFNYKAMVADTVKELVKPECLK